MAVAFNRPFDPYAVDAQAASDAAKIACQCVPRPMPWGKRTTQLSERRRIWRINHVKREALAHFRNTALSRKCVICGGAADEINHMKPLAGNRERHTCLNHQDNLEWLCQPCHKEVTAEQRAAGLI